MVRTWLLAAALAPAWCAWAATAATPPTPPILPPAAPIAPAWTDLAQLAADATLAALAADGRLDGMGDGAGEANPLAPLPRYQLEAVHPGSARLTTGQEQAVTLEIDSISYRLLLHDQDARSVGDGEAGPGGTAPATPGGACPTRTPHQHQHPPLPPT